ncbi:DnaD domain protein [Cohnella suwonensis]|uniref:DnaD domain protein n=1 Tax=Cohnella suwonensis TaxID=696072 RepID=A0ABW0LRT7_9BACL
MNDRNALARGMAEAYMDGAVSVPYALLRTYRALKLSDTDAMLLLQLIAFRQLEQNEFPTIEQLQERLGCSPAIVGQAVQKLLKLGFVTIDEQFDSSSGVQSEKYNLSGLFRRIGQLLAEGELPLRADQADSGSPAYAAASAESVSGGSGFGRSEERASGAKAGTYAAGDTGGVPRSLFSQFEQEFGRPLTPMEYETITSWLDQDQYADELIRFALKEAVFAGKLHFRYIDRILLEWSRNRVTNVEEARLHAQKFRTGR